MKRGLVSNMPVVAGALVIIVACLAAYIPAIKGGFIWDDDKYVTDNPLLTAHDGLHRIWFSTESPSQYFPLTYTTFWVEYRLWGLSPMGYHINNVVIHITSVLLLWLILRRLSIPGAWFASAIFALHPVQIESVAWVTERKNVLMLLFSLLSFLCWVEFALGTRSGRKAILFYAGSLFFYALALFSKTTACTLPAALVLILWLKRLPLTVKRWLQIAPFVAMGIAMGLLSIWWENYHQGTEQLNLELSLADKLLIAGRALWFYLWKLFWPTNLMFSYPRWHIDPTKIWQYIYPAGYAMMLVCAWLWREKIGRAIATAILFFAAMLLPMLGFFSLFTFLYTFVADHYQYAASIGPITLAAAGSAYVFRRSGRKSKFIMLSAGGVLLLVLGVLTWRQSRIYTNPETLWEDTLNKNPDSWMAHNEFGIICRKQGRFDEAMMHAKQRLELSSYTKTAFPLYFSDGYFNLAIILDEQNKFDEAINYYQKAIAVFPGNAKAYYRLGEVLAKQGKVESSILYFRRATEFNPDYYEAYYNYGTMMLQLAKTKEGQAREKLLSEACEKYKKAIDIKPDCYEAYYNWGNTLLELAKRKEGQAGEKLLSEACEKFKKATNIKPNSHEACYNWGTILLELAKRKEGQAREKLLSEACEKFKKAIDIKPDFQEAYQNWGTSLLRLSHQNKEKQRENLLKEAISAFMKVEKLKPGAAAYNLACAWCLLGNEDNCHMWLKIGEEEKTLPERQHAIEDPDLKAVRDNEWFKNIHWKGE
jgi:tetratricopeptide (TPR) repeat protein